MFQKEFLDLPLFITVSIRYGFMLSYEKIQDLCGINWIVYNILKKMSLFSTIHHVYLDDQRQKILVNKSKLSLCEE